MTNKDLETRLHNFAKTNLEKTIYGSNCENYQDKQLRCVFSEITDILTAKSDFPTEMPKILLVPPLKDIGSPKMEKIGTSAHKCLELLRTGNYNEEFSDAYPIVEKYLKQVVSQARESVNNSFGKHHESPESAELRLSDEFVGEVKNNADAINEVVESTKKDIEKIEKTADNIIPNMLTILGIFVGIIVAVVACYLSEFLADYKTKVYNHTLPIEFMRYLLMGHIIIMVTFVLLFLISKLTNRSVATRCSQFEAKEYKQEDKRNGGNPPKKDFENSSETPSNYVLTECDLCRNCCGPLARFKNLYTYMFAINVIIFLGYIITGIWHIINVFYRPKFNDFMENNIWILFVIIAAALILFFVMLSFFRVRKPKNEKK